MNTDNLGFAPQFRALAFTATVDARTNTATTGTGVPIYWLGSDKAAKNYPNFYDGSWDGLARQEDGTLVPKLNIRAWIGSIHNGTKDQTLFMGRPVGLVTHGSMHKTLGGSLFQGSSNKEGLNRLFALSPVITVAR